MIDDLDFTRHFSAGHAVPAPAHTQQEQSHIDDLGVIGETALKDKGFYARIISAVPSGNPRLPGETRILVVEDHEATAMTIARVLTRSGYQVMVARTRPELVKALPAIPDLIILDAVLPDVDGFDVLNRVRQHPKLRHVAVIMLTSLSDRKDIARGLALGANGYVTKPALPSTLLDAVQAVVGG